ncbi:MAG TPA: Mrp/NBP35 family ATP-binding protein [Candidatus Cloacimonadota bacterium]|jgi:Mrp family chromosome partitioning ATPase|nr:Mrp/NBP35 family ATP-binding protein [Candidatus Cloacimonadales bacterium]HPK41427.1 Mrp/NBP35 family ATP-binding protein [Candidatus Cloacimonadota bacterium]HPY97262.1 Mrp/NBP35 family ATP-binding protein [Candidatus Cloacimonadota bacterium]HQB41782.1 Mrp/NBP35 family ATP-binding protein [Candidatus Cloacimonadota bacterium]
MENNNIEQDMHLKENLSRIKHKIMVMSGKGGVGKSTIAVNLAYGLLLQGKKVGLMDVDIHGPSIAKMTGIEGIGVTGNENGRISPISKHENLHVISIASFLKSVDDPIIWRGPMKITLIKQFMSDVEWPELDYLIIDCPPGTGDEPLSVVQTAGNDTKSVIVTTQQDVAYLDVRKSIRFCKDVNMEILGLVENMVAVKCPHCGEYFNLFEGQNSAKAMNDFGVKLLGKVDFDKKITEASDNGEAYIYHNSLMPAGKQLQAIVDNIINTVEA